MYRFCYCHFRQGNRGAETLSSLPTQGRVLYQPIWQSQKGTPNPPNCSLGSPGGHTCYSFICEEGTKLDAGAPTMYFSLLDSKRQRTVNGVQSVSLAGLDGKGLTKEQLKLKASCLSENCVDRPPSFRWRSWATEGRCLGGPARGRGLPADQGCQVSPLN